MIMKSAALTHVAIFLGFAADAVIAQNRFKHLIWIKLGIVLPNNNASYADR